MSVLVRSMTKADHHQPCLPFGGTAGNAPVLPLRRLGPDGRRGLAVSCGGRLCVGSWTGTHGILFYGRRTPADIPCHACIPSTAAERGEEAAAGAILRGGFYSRIFSMHDSFSTALTSSGIRLSCWRQPSCSIT